MNTKFLSIPREFKLGFESSAQNAFWLMSDVIENLFFQLESKAFEYLDSFSINEETLKPFKDKLKDNISTLKSIFLSENDRKLEKAEKSCIHAVDLGLHEYEEKINIESSKKEFLRKEEFDKIHSDCVISAKKVFSDEKKSGDTNFILKYEKILESKLNISQTTFRTINKMNQETCERECEKNVQAAIAFYEVSIKSLITDQTIDFDEFIIKENILKAETQSFYEERTENLKDSVLREESFILYESALNRSRSDFENKFKMNLEIRENNLLKHVNQEVENFENLLKQTIEEKKYIKNDEIEKIYDEFSRKSYQRFKSAYIKMTAIEKKYLDKLIDKLEKKTNEQIKENEVRTENLKKIIKSCMLVIKTDYVSQMTPSIERAVDFEELSIQHEKIKKNLLEEFISKNQFFDDSWFQDRLQELSEDINSEYKSLYDSFKQRRELVLHLAVNNHLESYTEKMYTNIKKNSFNSEEELKNWNEFHTEEALTGFKMDVGRINDEENEYLIRLKEKIILTFEKILNENSTKKENIEKNARLSLIKLKEEYSDRMNTYLNEFRTKQELKNMHDIVEKELIESFETISLLKGSDLLEKYKTQMLEEMDDSYETILRKNYEYNRVRANKFIDEKTAEYLQKMEEKTNNNDFISRDRILEFHQIFLSEAKEFLKNKISEEFEESHTKLLIENLENLHSKTIADFDKKVEVSIKNSQLLIFQLKDSYVNEMKSMLNVINREEKLEIKHRELKIKSTNTFERENTINDKNKYEELYNELDQLLEEEYKILVNKYMQEKEILYEKLSTEIVDEYSSKMKEAIENSKYMSKDALLKLHKIFSENALSNYKKSFKQVSSLEENYIKKAEQGINHILEKFLIDNDLHQANLKASCQLVTIDLKSAYSSSMKSFLDEIDSEDKLKLLHEEQKMKYIQEFRNNPLSDQIWFEDLVKELTEMIESDLDESLKMYREKRESFINSVFNDCVTHYKNEIYRGIKDDDFIRKNLLKRKHDVLLNETLVKFDTNIPDISPSKEILSKKLEEALLKLLEEFKIENAKKKETFVNKIQLSIKELRNSYMNKTRLCMNEVEEEFLNVEHIKNKDEVLDQFDREYQAMDHISMEPYRKQLIDEIEKDFLELSDLFRLTLENNRTKFNAAMELAKKCYRNEMDKHLENNNFFTETELESRHVTSVNLALNILKENMKNIHSKQEEELRNSLKIMHDQYALANKLNSSKINAIGIDLGTTYSCAAVVIRGKVTFVPNGRGRTTTPSYVSFNDSGKVIVGDLAKDQAHQNPANTIFDIKRLIGRSFNDEYVKNDMQLWPFIVVEENNKPKIELRCSKRQRLHPEEISAILLKKLKDDTKAFLGYEIKNAVITVPAYFNYAQRQATKCAGAIAGLNVLKILNEPTAAAVAYTHQMKDDAKKNVFVYDLGGGTFDVAVVVLNRGNVDVKAVGGDSHLGGQDFDQRLVQLCMQEFKKQTKKKLDHDSKAIFRLRRFCERVKWDLSANSQATVSIDEIIRGCDFNYTVTRAKFEKINMDLFEKTMVCVSNVLKDAGLSASEIDDIVTVGGSSRIPKIQDMLSIYFGGKVLNKSINPDEAVAYGAAIQAAALDGTSIDEYSKVIQDVAPFSIGVKLKNGNLSVIIPKNSKLPSQKSKDYQTSEDNQTKVEISVYEGEERIADKNRLLGNFLVDGIPKKPVGEERITVVMEIDDEGILRVTGKCESSSSSSSIKVRDYRNKISEGELKMLIKKGKDS